MLNTWSVQFGLDDAKRLALASALDSETIVSML